MLIQTTRLETFREGEGAYLPAQVVDDSLVLAVVPDSGGLLLVPLADLKLQLGVGSLQGAHLLQVCGQAVVEVLHCHLLLAGEDDAAAATADTRERSGQV